MNFNLKRPCPHCPFRADIEPYLRPGRASEILRSLAAGASFPCHKTAEHSYDGDGDPEYIPSSDDEFCAGALILMERSLPAGCMTNQLARIAHRLRMFNPAALDTDAPVYASFSAMRAAHKKTGKRQRSRNDS